MAVQESGRPLAVSRWARAVAFGAFLAAAALTTVIVSSSGHASNVSSHTPTSEALGYWTVSADGHVSAFGSAKTYGVGLKLPKGSAATAIAGTPDGRGYWVVTSTGRVFALGDARRYGGLGGPHPVARPGAPVVGIAPTTGGGGYWLVDRLGQVYSFGHAHFFGPRYALRLRSSVVSIVADPEGRGYWLVTRTGQVLGFGAAHAYGARGTKQRAQVAAMAATPDGQGYWLVTKQGQVETFGDARYFGSASERVSPDVVGIAPTANGAGYWLVGRNGATWSFGNARVPAAAHQVLARRLGVAGVAASRLSGRSSGNGLARGPAGRAHLSPPATTLPSSSTSSTDDLGSSGSSLPQGVMATTTGASPVTTASPGSPGTSSSAGPSTSTSAFSSTSSGGTTSQTAMTPVVPATTAPTVLATTVPTTRTTVPAAPPTQATSTTAAAPTTAPTTLPVQATTTTTSGPTATAPQTGSCTNPSFSSSSATGTDNVDPGDGYEYWWVNNDAWSGSHGPQTIYVCNQSSWYAVSDQPNLGGQVETYPDTEYDVGGRDNGTTKTIAQYSSITSTFSEDFPLAGSWDAAYDLWLNNWSKEVMIWNQWSGGQGYWPGIAKTSLTLDGVPYTFYDNNGELMFFRTNQVATGSVDILAAFNWLVANGYVSSSDVPTQLEYGVEIAATNGTETFPVTDVTFSLS